MKKSKREIMEHVRDSGYLYAQSAFMRVATLEELEAADADLYVGDGWDPVYDDSEDEALLRAYMAVSMSEIDEMDEVELDLLLGDHPKSYVYRGIDAADFVAFAAEVRRAAFAPDPMAQLQIVLDLYSETFAIARDLRDAIAAKTQECSAIIGAILSA